MRRRWATAPWRRRCSDCTGCRNGPITSRSKSLMADFSPHRSLATMHLWTSLKEAGKERRETLLGHRSRRRSEIFAAWVDEEGRLLRFRFRAKGADRVDPAAERNDRALVKVRRQVKEYSEGKRQEFEFELNAEGPEFDRLVWRR